jgi:biopolymer transport protein ExbD
LFRRFKRFADTETPNLIGIMNLFMVLIPFLLMGAAFYHIAVIPSSLPTHTPQESDVPTTPKTVTINMVILPDLIKLSASSTSLNEEELSAMSGEWPNTGGKYQLAAITQQLKDIKADYPKSNTMIVLPHPTLKYEMLVTVLDSTRDYKLGVDPRSGEDLRADLFPIVVFSRFIPKDQAPEPVPAGAGDETGAVDEEGAQ